MYNTQWIFSGNSQNNFKQEQRILDFDPVS